MLKKILILGVALIMTLGVFGLTACGNPKGKFYTLQEAYDEGHLTVDDLQKIANYHNNGTPYTEAISNAISETIKKAWAEKLRNDETDPRPEATAEDIVITNYYGNYINCIVVTLDYGTHADIAVPITVMVAGVSFNYGHPRHAIICWKQ